MGYNFRGKTEGRLIFCLMGTVTAWLEAIIPNWESRSNSAKSSKTSREIRILDSFFFRILDSYVKSPNGMLATLQLFLNTLCRSIKLYLWDKFGWTCLQFMCFKLEGKIYPPCLIKNHIPKLMSPRPHLPKNQLPLKGGMKVLSVSSQPYPRIAWAPGSQGQFQWVPAAYPSYLAFRDQKKVRMGIYILAKKPDTCK